jgi:hypothetical protein
VKKWFVPVFLGSFLLLSLLSGCGGGSGGGGNGGDGDNGGEQIVYYDGTITITAQGDRGENWVYDESTTVSSFKIENNFQIPAQSWVGTAASGYEANIFVNDLVGGDAPRTIQYSGSSSIKKELLTLAILKSGETYSYKMQINGAYGTPAIPVGSDTVPQFWWSSKIVEGSLGYQFLPGTIQGEATDKIDNVTLGLKWKLERHIRN